MAKPIATINGKPVYSDKNMTGVVNTRVTFSDGSWCDVATGEVENNGPGYINIGAPPSGKAGKKESDTKNLSGSMLDVKDLSATDLDIQPYDGTEVIVTKEGSKSDIDNISVYVNGNTVVVEGEGGQASGGTSIRIGGISMTGVRGMSTIVSGSNVVVRGGNISIGGGGSKRDENDTKVKIQVPRGMPVSVSNIDGFTSVGDIEGPFRVISNTGGDVHVGSVGDTTIIIQGSTDVRVKSVRENLAVSIQGSGDVKVKRGEVNNLNINIQGSGDCSFSGRATNASLTVMGSGDIDVDYVENRPMTNCMGSGDIKIGNW
jgi:hypothetical protein